MRSSSRSASLLTSLVLALSSSLPLAACGDDGAPSDPGHTPGRDGGTDDAGPDAAPPGPDAGTMGPFPDHPLPGQFAWAVSSAGAGDPVSVATDGSGRIFVVAVQSGPVDLGDVHLPAPRGGALVVLALTPQGKALWGRTLDGASQRVDAQAIAVLSSGDVLLGGRYEGAYTLGDTVLPVTAGSYGGFVARLSGQDGELRWAAPAGSSFTGSPISGLAAGEASGAESIYIYGESRDASTVGGLAVESGTFLVRLTGEGHGVWARHVPLEPGLGQGLVLDPDRGPTVIGRFFGTITVGTQTFTAEGFESSAQDLLVLAYDPDGHERFGRALAGRATSYSSSLGVGPEGSLHVATDTGGGPLQVDDHLLPFVQFSDDVVHVRLSPDGRFGAAHVVEGQGSEHPYALTVDAAGASYVVDACAGALAVDPEIACAKHGGAIVSYGPDDAYRWATIIEPALVEGLAPAPGHRLVVAGVAHGDVDFGAVTTGTNGLFVASLATGAPPAPSPLPAPPTVTDAAFAGTSSRQIRQGGRETLVIHGTGLDRVTSVRVGDLDVHVPAGAASPTELRAPLHVPHGHAAGTLALVVANAGGSASLPAVVQVTPIVIAPAGTDGGRGTFDSPYRLCRPTSATDGWFTLTAAGDEMMLLDGVHECSDFLSLTRGVTLRGQSRGGTRLRGAFGQPFYLLYVASDGVGGSRLESLTIEGAGGKAIWLDNRVPVVVHDVDVRDAGGTGISVEAPGANVTIDGYRYLNGAGGGLFIDDDAEVDARHVTIESRYSGIVVSGRLVLDDADVTSSSEALVVGNENHLDGKRRSATVTRSALRSQGSGVRVEVAQLSLIGSTLEGVSDDAFPPLDGVWLMGGQVSLVDTRVSGFSVGLDLRHEYLSELPDARRVDVSLEGSSVAGLDTGIFYQSGPDPDDRLALRRSTVIGARSAVWIEGSSAHVDLGTAASPGENRLVSTTGPALLDERTVPDAPIDAHGTTLNGASFVGDVLGPVENAAAYVLRGANTIRF